MLSLFFKNSENLTAPSDGSITSSAVHTYSQQNPKQAILNEVSSERVTNLEDLEQVVLNQILSETEKRATNLGYGLGVFIGRLIGTRNDDNDTFDELIQAEVTSHTPNSKKK